MAFSIPDIKTLAQTVRSAFRAETPGTDAWVWPNNVYVAAKVFSQIVWSMYGRLKQIDRDRFVLTAQGVGLERHGADYGITRKQATYATGPFDIIGVPSTVIPAGSVFTRSDNTVYTTDLDVTLTTAGTGTVNGTCGVTGTTGNSIYGTIFTSPNGAITSVTANIAGIGQGTSIETYESLRARILFRKRNPPQGGSKSDYVLWARSVAGVTRAFVDTGTACGLGRVVVYPLMDDTYPASYGIPQASDIAAIQAYINSVKPATANVVVAAPVALAIDATISMLQPATQAIRQAAADEISNGVYRSAAVSTSSDPTVVYLSTFWQAVASVSGETSFTVAEPTANIEVTTGMMPVVRGVTFT